MAKRRKKTRDKSSTKLSETSFKATKKLKKNGGARKRAATTRAATSSTARPRSLTGRDARKEERFRELVAWHMLEGMDEAAARLRAEEEMRGDL